jgi:hypothetical protein
MRRDLGYPLYTRFHCIGDIRELDAVQECVRDSLQDSSRSSSHLFSNARSLLGSVLRERVRVPDAMKIMPDHIMAKVPYVRQSMDRLHHSRNLYPRMIRGYLFHAKLYYPIDLVQPLCNAWETLQ